ncbi:MAG: DEAD/DEAH box helicase, partial [Opitutales bacterium]|nr:DEAD/DEAH box helicase [Opitutales bacterium]
MNPLDLDITINLPDLWQQQAVREIQDGKDVIVDAPTGAGKTYIFELLVESKKFKGQLVYTVPTRALANDKLLEWREKGWNVGIATGDISENPDAPVLVATLETQKNRLFEREGPKLLVVDEYQMLADSSRGVNYEITIAIAPLTTQLLLLSGSVGNASSVQKWLTRLGREAILISHKERPVPQEQIYLEALPDRISKSIYGYWPKNIAKALKANLEPILIFAPQRKDAERIARQVASMMPDDDPLELNPEQKKLTDDKLKKLLKSRVAYHHSGLSYTQRAGVIEPLAKHGQLRVVVATTGLGSGINFSMRSVIVADRDYRIEESKVQLRPDELLQMFGRAGRRGKDDRGYILVLPQKPRLEDAHPIHLRRSNVLDWSSILRAMHLAVTQGDEPLEAAEKLVNDLFSEIPPELGNLKQADPTQSHATKSPKSTPSAEKSRKDLSIQMLNSKGEWERQKGPVAVPLSETVFYHKKRWKSSTSVAAALQYFDLGTVCILQKSAPRIYGHDWVVAQFPKEGHDPHSLI